MYRRQPIIEMGEALKPVKLIAYSVAQYIFYDIRIGKKLYFT